jgi:molybdate transport system substrate-binding protein
MVLKGGRCLAALLAGVAITAGCGAPVAAELTIAAAADLRYALDEVVAAFRRTHPGAPVSVTYGSSGNFHAQLLNGAPYDLFLSADIAYPQQLADRGLVLPDSLFRYARGRIVVWTTRASALDVERLGLSALLADSVSRVAIANPEHAPYGRAAESVLQSAGVLEAVRPRLVLGENIAQTLQFVQSGSADVGIVALSLALAPPVAGSGRYWLVPAPAHPPIEQGGAIMRTARNPDGARAFRTFLMGAEARAVLERYGFEVTPGRQPAREPAQGR